MFISKAPIENHLSESEKAELVVQRKKEGNRDKVEFIKEVLHLKDSLKSKHYHKMWGAEADGNRKRREELQEVLFGTSIPNLEVAIPKFHDNEEVKSVEKLLLEVAAKKVKPTPDMIKTFANFLALKIAVKAGNRPEAMANLKMKHWYSKRVAKLTPDGKPQGQDERVHGYLVEQPHHKTGSSYKLEIWLDKVDYALCRCYLEPRIEVRIYYNKFKEINLVDASL